MLIPASCNIHNKSPCNTLIFALPEQFSIGVDKNQALPIPESSGKLEASIWKALALLFSIFK